MKAYDLARFRNNGYYNPSLYLCIVLEANEELRYAKVLYSDGLITIASTIDLLILQSVD